MTFSRLSISNQAKNKTKQKTETKQLPSPSPPPKKKPTKTHKFFLHYNTPASTPDGDETKVWFQKWQRKCVTDRNDRALSTAGDTIKWNAFSLSLSNTCRAGYIMLLEHIHWAQSDPKQRRLSSSALVIVSQSVSQLHACFYIYICMYFFPCGSDICESRRPNVVVQKWLSHPDCNGTTLGKCFCFQRF